MPVRGVVTVLADADRFTVPLPDPLLPDVIVSHEPLRVAVQVHPAAAVTATATEPAVSPMFCVAGDAPYVQATPTWLTVMVCPATVSVPVRAVVVPLAAAANVTEPLPLPVAPAEIVSQLLFDAAVHAQPLADTTATVPDPPPASIAWVAGVAENEQGTENMKVFDTWLVPVPPGPTDDTRDS